MKKLKVLISAVLVLSIFSLCIVHAFAADENSGSPEDKISPELAEKMAEADEDELIPIALWLMEPTEKVREEVYQKFLKSFDMQTEIENERNHILSTLNNKNEAINVDEISEKQAKVRLTRLVEKEINYSNNESIISKLKAEYSLDVIIYTSCFAPLVFVYMTKEELTKLVRSQDISHIYYANNEPGEELDEPNNNMSSVDKQNDRANTAFYGYWQSETNISVVRNAFGYSGAGIKIGHIETNGIPDKSLPVFSLAYNRIHNVSGNNTTATHSTRTAKILVGHTSDYDGVAPNAELFCNYGSGDINKIGAIETILSYGVNILSASIYLGNSNNNIPTYDYCSSYLDYIVHHSNVTVCISAGNTSQYTNMGSGAQAYNVITVGNIDDNKTLNTSDDVIHDTDFLNSNYLPFKPDICAPGYRVAVPGNESYANNGGGGTSSAAPVVSGICALLMQANADLIDNPMLMKSVLLSSSTRIPNMTHQTTSSMSSLPALSHQYGSGEVNAVEAFNTLDSSQYFNISSNEWIQNSSHYIDIEYTLQDLNYERRIYICINWKESLDKNNIFNYTPYNQKKYYISLYDPDDDLVSSSLYEYDHKQVIGYQPEEAGTYTLLIQCFGLGDYYPEVSVAYNIPE